MQYEGELTQDKKTILKGMSVNDELIDKNELAEWQISILKQYDYAEDYLKSKYPSYDIAIVGVEEKNAMNDHTRFMIAERGSDWEKEGEYYYLDIYEDNDAFSGKDNFFEYLIRDGYEEYVRKLMSNNNIAVTLVDFLYASGEGESVGEGITVDDVTEGRVHIEPTVVIQFDTAKVYKDCAGLFIKAKKVIETNGLTGFFRFRVVEEDGNVYSETHYIGEEE